MSMQSRLSLLGLYNWDDTLFDSMVLPEDWDNDTKDILINNILMECAELEVIYANWDFMRGAIEAWSSKEVVTWNRLYQAMLIEYDPIQNYNRVEKTNTQNRGAMTHGGKDTVAGSGNDSDVSTGFDSQVGTGYDSDVGSGSDTVTNSITSFDNNTLTTHDQSQNQKGSTITHNKNSTITFNKGTTVTHNHGITDTTTYGHTITDTTGSLVQSEISGNIGVTTSQQMLESELELAPKLNVMNYIIDSFKNRFCLLVY